VGGRLGFSGEREEGGGRPSTESATLFYLATRFLPVSMCGVLCGGLNGEVLRRTLFIAIENQVLK